MDTLIQQYVKEGFTYLEITELLNHRHGYVISLSTLKRKLRRMGIKKRSLVSARSSMQEVEAAVQTELSGSGANIGYRRVHRALISQGLICRQVDVRRIIKTIDPEGVNRRRRRRLHTDEVMSLRVLIMYGILTAMTN